MSRIKVFEDAGCVAYMAFSNCDYEEFDDINELVDEEDVYITGYVFSKFCGKAEPYDGASIKGKYAYKNVKTDMLQWLNKPN